MVVCEGDDDDAGRELARAHPVDRARHVGHALLLHGALTLRRGRKVIVGGMVRNVVMVVGEKQDESSGNNLGGSGRWDHLARPSRVRRAACHAVGTSRVTLGPAGGCCVDIKKGRERYCPGACLDERIGNMSHLNVSGATDR